MLGLTTLSSELMPEFDQRVTANRIRHSPIGRSLPSMSEDSFDNSPVMNPSLQWYKNPDRYPSKNTHWIWIILSCLLAIICLILFNKIPDNEVLVASDLTQPTEKRLQTIDDENISVHIMYGMRKKRRNWPRSLEEGQLSKLVESVFKDLKGSTYHLQYGDVWVEDRNDWSVAVEYVDSESLEHLQLTVILNPEEPLLLPNIVNTNADDSPARTEEIDDVEVLEDKGLSYDAYNSSDESLLIEELETKLNQDSTTQTPTTSEPSREPSLKPMTAEPSKIPSLKPTTAEPSKKPSLKPTTAEPTKKPSLPPTEAESSSRDNKKTGIAYRTIQLNGKKYCNDADSMLAHISANSSEWNCIVACNELSKCMYISYWGEGKCRLTKSCDLKALNTAPDAKILIKQKTIAKSQLEILIQKTKAALPPSDTKYSTFKKHSMWVNDCRDKYDCGSHELCVDGFCVRELTYQCYEYEFGQDNQWCDHVGAPYKLTKGKNENYPGCGDLCWCCQEICKKSDMNLDTIGPQPYRKQVESPFVSTDQSSCFSPSYHKFKCRRKTRKEVTIPRFFNQTVLFLGGSFSRRMLLHIKALLEGKSFKDINKKTSLWYFHNETQTTYEFKWLPDLSTITSWLNTNDLNFADHIVVSIGFQDCAFTSRCKPRYPFEDNLSGKMIAFRSALSPYESKVVLRSLWYVRDDEWQHACFTRWNQNLATVFSNWPILDTSWALGKHQGRKRECISQKEDDHMNELGRNLTMIQIFDFLQRCRSEK